MEEIEKAYGIYWKFVKDSVDKNGWTYSKDVSHILDAYYEHNTEKEIEFQKHYEYTGPWRGYRWRPKDLAHLNNNIK